MFLESFFQYLRKRLRYGRSSLPASVGDGIKGPGVCTILQQLPRFLVNGDGAAEAAKGVTIAVSSI